MTPSVDRKGSLFGLVTRFCLNTIARPLVMGMMVFMVASGVVENVLPQQASLNTSVQPQVQQHHDYKESGAEPLPLSMQARARLKGHQRILEATMTTHQLTTAHLFSRHSIGNLSSGISQNPKHG